MSRKTDSFSQLVNYLSKENSKSFSWNMYSNTANKQEVINEFLNNSKYIKHSRGKIYLYHEVISLKNENLNKELSQKILYDLANEYIQKRAKNHLIFASIHFDTKNPHIHLAISSNEIEGKRRKRLSKKEFSNIQKYVEEYKNEKYPSLLKSNTYGKVKDFSKFKQKEQEIKHKRKKQPTREQIRQDLENIFSRSNSKKDLEKSLNLGKYELYQRGKTFGIIFENKKYRLRTLGVDELYFKAIENIDTRENEFTKTQKEVFEKNKTSENIKNQEKKQKQEQNISANSLSQKRQTLRDKENQKENIKSKDNSNQKSFYR